MSPLSPLRLLIAAVGILAIGLGIVLCFHAPETLPAAIWLFIVGTILLIGGLFEKIRYKPIETVGPSGSLRTLERFVDPASGKLVEVYFDAKNGERTYVAAADSKII